ncbi:MAG: TonB-dependent receptor [Bacteroidota bacterium]
MKYPLVIITILTTISIGAYSQAIIRGKVTNFKTKSGMPFANVYLDKTSIGVSTDENGNFELLCNNEGGFELIASYIGYEPARINIFLKSDSTYSINFKLIERINQLDQVVITAKRDKKWKKDLEKFKQYFLGESKVSQKCDILNPEVLYFDHNDLTFRAYARGPLIIENKYLGYKISYDLLSFLYIKKLERIIYKGHVRYEELESIHASKSVKLRRLKAYQGSLMHMLRSIVRDDVDGSDFVYYQEKGEFSDIQLYPKRNLTAINSEIFTRKNKNTEENGRNYLTFDGFIRVEYLPRTSTEVMGSNFVVFPETSWININRKSVEFTDAGSVVRPLELIEYGALADQRFGTSLPLDYEPIGSKVSKEKSEMDIVRALSTNLPEHNSIFPKERVFLDLGVCQSKPGDSIKFNATLVKGAELNESDLSRTLYVELINDDFELIKYIVVRLDGGKGSGIITLPNYLSGDKCYIRAYTSWMKNFSEDFFFLKPVYLSQQAFQPKNLTVNFYPESGMLLHNTKSNMALRVMNSHGVGQRISGTLYDENNRIIDSFKTNYLGWTTISNFKLKRQYTYYVKLRNVDETFFLPKVANTGVSLTVSRDEKNIVVEVNYLNLSQEKARGYLIVQSRGEIKYLTPVLPESSREVVAITDNIFDEGISVISYSYLNFDLEVKRAIYIKKNDGIDELNDSELCDNETRENFFLLNSDLKHILITNANQYLQNSSDSKVALNSLLMTSNWSTVPVIEIASKNDPEEKYAIEQGISFSGNVSEMNSDIPISDKTINVLVKDEKPIFHSALIDNEGNFEFKDLNFTDTTELVFSVQGVTDKFDLRIDSIEYEYKRPDDYFSGVRNSESEKMVKYFSSDGYSNVSGVLLDEVVIKRKKMSELQKAGGFVLHGEPTYSFDFEEDDPRLQNTSMQGGLLSFLVGNVPNLSVSYDVGGRVNNVIIGGPVSLPGGGGAAIPLFLVNSVPVDLFSVNNMNVFDVSKIEILTGASATIYGSRAAGGVISITTKVPSFKISRNSSNVSSRKLKGYTTFPSY